ERPSIPDNALQATWDMAGIQAGETYVARIHAVDSEGNSYFSNTFQFATEGLIIHGLYNALVGDADVEALLNGDKRPGQVIWNEQFIGEPLQSVKLFISSTEDPRYA